MATQQDRRKSHENLLSPRLKSRPSESVRLEVNYERSTNMAKTCVKTAATKQKVIKCTSGHSAEDPGRGRYTGVVHTERNLVKNLIILGLSFIFVLSPFHALQNLQSSFFMETGLGLKALCIVYGLAVLSCFYAPAFVQSLTPNWTLAVSFVMVAIFIATFFYPQLYTLVPSAVLLGLFMGPMFIARNTFLMQMVSRMSCMTESIRDKVQRRLLRMLGLFANASQIAGNLITALLLHYGGDVYIYPLRSLFPVELVLNAGRPLVRDPSTPTLLKATGATGLCVSSECSQGTVFRDTSSFVFVLTSNVSLMLVSVYLGLALIGVALVTTLLDKFDMYIYQDPLERPEVIRTLKNIGMVFLDSQQRLLLPMVFFMGFEQGFLFADFTKSYVSCALGLEAVGYTMMAMGLMCTLGSLCVHQFCKHIRRPLIMASGFILQSGLLMVLWLWRPDTEDRAVFYVIATGWGLCNAIWETLTLTFVATTCSEEWHAPFAVYFMTQCLGLTTSFLCSLFLCTEMKIYVLAGCLLLGALPYSYLEFRFFQQQDLQERTAIL